MIRVGLVEDDEDYRRELCGFLDRYTAEYGETFHVRCFSDGAQLVFDYKPDYDVLLMDIEMPKLSGMDAARQVRALDPAVMILFVTNMAQYAIEGYSVQAKAYLLKPLNYYGFALEMQSAIASLQRRGTEYLLLSTDDGIVKVPESHIIYIETDGHDLLFHGLNEVYRTRMSMKEADQRFSGRSFARSSVSYLVNLAYVTGVSADTVTVRGETLQLSRNKRKDFLSALTAHVGRR